METGIGFANILEKDCECLSRPSCNDFKLVGNK